MPQAIAILPRSPINHLSVVELAGPRAEMAIAVANSPDARLLELIEEYRQLGDEEEPLRECADLSWVREGQSLTVRPGPGPEYPEIFALYAKADQLHEQQGTVWREIEAYIPSTAEGAIAPLHLIVSDAEAGLATEPMVQNLTIGLRRISAAAPSARAPA